MARVAAVSRAVSAGVIAAVALVAPASTTVAPTMNLYMNTSRIESLQPDCHGCTIVRTDGLRACEKVESLVVSGSPPPLRQFARSYGEKPSRSAKREGWQPAST